MKRRNNEYVAIAVVVAIVATIGIGSSIMNAQNEVEVNHEMPRNLSTQRPVDQVLQVDTNKNSPAKTELKEEPEKITEDTVEEIVEEPKEEAVLEEVDIYEEAVAYGNEITFIWPTKGEIALDFSLDKTVFDPTLEQYRTNDSICISTEAGAEVQVACDGIVKRVFKDYEKGMTVVINHADGWSTTYSQLDEKVAVKEGDSVEKGSVIGQVSMPTKYGTALGAHLDFKISQNDYVIDPKVALSE